MEMSFHTVCVVLGLIKVLYIELASWQSCRAVQSQALRLFLNVFKFFALKFCLHIVFLVLHFVAFEGKTVKTGKWLDISATHIPGALVNILSFNVVESIVTLVDVIING